MDTRINLLEIAGNAIVGGMENYLIRLVAGLPAERFSVTCMCPFESAITNALREAGAEVLIAPMPAENPSWRAIQLACSLVKSRSIDVLHAHMSNAHVLAGLVARLCNKPALATVHGRSLSMGDLEAHRLAGSHLLTVCRQAYYHALSIGLNASQVHLIPNGVDATVYHPDCRGDHLHQELGLTPKTPLVGFVGRLSPEKAPQLFVRIAWLVRRIRPDVHFVIAGNGPLRDDLEAMCASFDIGATLHFLGVRSDMPRIYGSLDMLLSTSHSEAMPLCILEAMAAGIPVIATRVGGVPEVIEHDHCGFLVEENDLDAFVEHVVALLDDPAQRRRFGERARARVMEEFTLDDGNRAVCELLARLAQKPERNGVRAVGLGKPAVVPAASEGKLL